MPGRQQRQHRQPLRQYHRQSYVSDAVYIPPPHYHEYATISFHFPWGWALCGLHHATNYVVSSGHYVGNLTLLKADALYDVKNNCSKRFKPTSCGSVSECAKLSTPQRSKHRRLTACVYIGNFAAEVSIAFLGFCKWGCHVRGREIPEEFWTKMKSMHFLWFEANFEALSVLENTKLTLHI